MAHLKTKLLGLGLLLSAQALMAQVMYPGKSFYDTRVINGQSVEMLNEGTMKFIISHRFGAISGGAYELWGLDNSTIRLGLDYGIKNWWTIGIGRSSFEKTFDGFTKFRLVRQKYGEEKSPVSMVWFSSIAINGERWEDPERENYFSSRIDYTHQLLIAHKFNDRLTGQLMPSLVHRNLVETADEANDVLAIGTAARYVASKRFTFSVEYYYVLPDQLAEGYYNSLSVGIDIETKGHVFQLSFGNSRGMIEKFFIAETTGQWSEGDIHFGFNITRDFKVKGKKY